MSTYLFSIFEASHLDDRPGDQETFYLKTHVMFANGAVPALRTKSSAAIAHVHRTPSRQRLGELVEPVSRRQVGGSSPEEQPIAPLVAQE